VRAAPGIFVLVLVLERRGTLIECAIAKRLEGSRFGAHLSALAKFVSALIHPKRAKTGGSRERPNGSQLEGRA
jgi:hypothetical protein